MSIKANLDDIAAKLPQIEFKRRKTVGDYYNQYMQSLRGGRQFILRTYIAMSGEVRLTLIEYGTHFGEEIVIASRKAERGNPDTFQKALKSLEKKAKCKLYYRLLISTDGEYV